MTIDPMLGQLLKEVRELRADVLERDDEIKASIMELSDRVKTQNGRINRLEAWSEAHKATMTERSWVRLQIWAWSSSVAAGISLAVVSWLIAHQT
jgi:hypothetical protein